MIEQASHTCWLQMAMPPDSLHQTKGSVILQTGGEKPQCPSDCTLPIFSSAHITANADHLTDISIATLLRV